MRKDEVITIRCRRCLGEITHVEPGALVGCRQCRLYTRAVVPHIQPMTRITCRAVTMGYRVFFIPGRDFDAVLAEFKAAVAERAYVIRETERPRASSTSAGGAIKGARWE